MARTATEAAIVGGPTIASTLDDGTLHLRSEGRADRTMLTYQNALAKLALDSQLTADSVRRRVILYGSRLLSCIHGPGGSGDTPQRGPKVRHQIDHYGSTDAHRYCDDAAEPPARDPP